jgi:hypothetical protein
MNINRIVRFVKLVITVIDDIWRISAWENVTWSFNGTNDATTHQKKRANIKAKATKEHGTFKDK